MPGRQNPGAGAVGFLAEPVSLGIRPRFAAALSDPCRGQILLELDRGNLSPSQFAAKSGEDLSYVARNFRQLKRMGYAEVCDTRTDRHRGAAVEHMYRGVGPTGPDPLWWHQLPAAVRRTESFSILSSYFALAQAAHRSRRRHTPEEFHFSWNTCVLDKIAFQELAAELEGIERWVLGLELEAEDVIQTGEEEATGGAIGLMSFRSPRPAANLVSAPVSRIHPLDQQRGNEPALRPELAKALSNRWRARILMELDLRPISPSRFAREIGGDASYIARCFRELAEWGFVAVLEEHTGGRRRGARERIYVSRKRVYLDQEGWDALPLFAKDELGGNFWPVLLERIREALLAGTFDADPDRHRSFRRVVVDRRRWQQIPVRLDKAHRLLVALERESVERAAGSMQRLIPTVVGLTCYPSA
jgi:DNA-binding transcriptional ArsR family regulator